MQQRESVALVSMPGGGKSTIGRHLAKRLSWSFVDTDVLIEGRAGCSIQDIFERDGELAFREIEERVIDEMAGSPKTVLATGGGSVLRESNRRALHTRSHVIYLKSSPDELFRRLRNDTRRPLLQGNDLITRLRELYAERDPLYRETAHFTIDTGGPSVPTIVNMILMQLELAGIVDPASVPSPVDAKSGDASRG